MLLPYTRSIRENIATKELKTTKTKLLQLEFIYVPTSSDAKTDSFPQAKKIAPYLYIGLQQNDVPANLCSLLYYVIRNIPPTRLYTSAHWAPMVQQPPLSFNIIVYNFLHVLKEFFSLHKVTPLQKLSITKIYLLH